MSRQDVISNAQIDNPPAEGKLRSIIDDIKNKKDTPLEIKYKLQRKAEERIDQEEEQGKEFIDQVAGFNDLGSTSQANTINQIADDMMDEVENEMEDGISAAFDNGVGEAVGGVASKEDVQRLNDPLGDHHPKYSAMSDKELEDEWKKELNKKLIGNITVEEAILDYRDEILRGKVEVDEKEHHKKNIEAWEEAAKESGGAPAPEEPKKTKEASEQTQPEIGEPRREFKINEGRLVRRSLLTTSFKVFGSIFAVKAFRDLPTFILERVGKIGPGKDKKQLAKIMSELGKEGVSESERKGKLVGEVINLDKLEELQDKIESMNIGEDEKDALTGELNRIIEDYQKQKNSLDRTTNQELKRTLDTWVTAKVTGLELAKELFNTTTKGTAGAMLLSGVGIPAVGTMYKIRALGYGVFSIFERRQNVSKQKLIEARKRGESSKEAERASWLKDVFIGGIKDTFKGATFQGDEEKYRKSLKLIKSYANIARFLGIGATALHGGFSVENFKQFSEALEKTDIKSALIDGFIKELWESGKFDIQRLGKLFNIGNGYEPKAEAIGGSSEPSCATSEISEATEQSVGETETPPPAAGKPETPPVVGAPEQTPPGAEVAAAGTKVEDPLANIKFNELAGDSIWKRAQSIVEHLGQDVKSAKGIELSDMIKDKIMAHPEQYGLVDSKGNALSADWLRSHTTHMSDGMLDKIDFQKATTEMMSSLKDTTGQPVSIDEYTLSPDKAASIMAGAQANNEAYSFAHKLGLNVRGTEDFYNPAAEHPRVLGHTEIDGHNVAILQGKGGALSWHEVGVADGQEALHGSISGNVNNKEDLTAAIHNQMETNQVAIAAEQVPTTEPSFQDQPHYQQELRYFETNGFTQDQYNTFLSECNKYPNVNHVSLTEYALRHNGNLPSSEQMNVLNNIGASNDPVILDKVVDNWSRINVYNSSTQPEYAKFIAALTPGQKVTDYSVAAAAFKKFVGASDLHFKSILLNKEGNIIIEPETGGPNREIVIQDRTGQPWIERGKGFLNTGWHLTKPTILGNGELGRQGFLKMLSGSSTESGGSSDTDSLDVNAQRGE